MRMICHQSTTSESGRDKMVTVSDAAAYILLKEGSMTAVKLERLCYYA